MKTTRLFRNWIEKQWSSYRIMSRKFKKATAALWKRLTQFETVQVEQSETHFDVFKPSSGSYINPLFWLQQSIQFAIRFNKSRSLNAFLQGAPAALCVGLAVGGYYLTEPNRTDVVESLKTERNLAADGGDFEKADFFARKLCFAQNNSPQSLFSRALLLHQFEKKEHARSLAIQLANNRQYVPAMEWLCQIDLTEFQERENSVTVAERKSLIDRLQQLLERAERNPKVHIMLGTLYMQMEAYTEAEPPIRRATELLETTPPNLWWSLSLILQNREDMDGAREYASRAADGFLQTLANERLNNKEKALVTTVRSLVVAERESEAVRLLKSQIAQYGGAEAAQRKFLLCDVYSLWAQRLRTTRSSDLERLAEAVQHLRSGLAILPNHPALIEELGILACSPEGTKILTEPKLLRLIDSGISPGLIHFILGTRLAERGPEVHEEALRHLTLAMNHNLSFPGLMNNLANAMVEQEDPDLEYAHSLVELAIEAMPDQPYFFDTRGKILMKMGKLGPAIADFERALVAVELRPAIHRQLCNLYSQLGDEKAAERHQKMAQALEGK